MTFPASVRQAFSATAVGTNAGASATQAAPSDTGRHYFCSGIQVSGDAAALVTIESPAATILWKVRMTAAFDRAFSFAPGTIVGAKGAAILVKVSASTSNCENNIQGYLV